MFQVVGAVSVFIIFAAMVLPTGLLAQSGDPSGFGMGPQGWGPGGGQQGRGGPGGFQMRPGGMGPGPSGPFTGGSEYGQMGYGQGASGQGQGSRTGFGSGSMNRPPPPMGMLMVKGFAIGAQSTSSTSSGVSLFMLDLMPPRPAGAGGEGQGPGLLGVIGQAPSYGGLYGTSSDVYGTTTSAPQLTGRLRLAGVPYRLINVTLEMGTVTAATGATGQGPQGPIPSRLVAYVTTLPSQTSSIAGMYATTSVDGTSTLSDGSTVVGQVALTFAQVEGSIVATGGAVASQGQFSLIGTLEPPRPPQGSGNGPGMQMQGDSGMHGRPGMRQGPQGTGR